MSTSFDRQFQNRLELIFKKAEYDRMQEYRRQRELEKKMQDAGQQPQNDNGDKCQKKPAPGPR